jgi:hypothetical protein
MKPAELSLVRFDKGSLRVPCRRQAVERSLREHLACPYCFGTAADVRTHDHARFCDFDPKRDPIAFGFPDRLGRYR